MLIGFAVILIGFLVFAFEGFSAVNSAANGVSDPSGVFWGFGIAAVGMFITLVARSMRAATTLPPPPLIQQPMVPAGAQGPVGLNCPACGAPAEAVDRFGVATCTHCGARFLVR